MTFTAETKQQVGGIELMRLTNSGIDVSNEDLVCGGKNAHFRKNWAIAQQGVQS